MRPVMSSVTRRMNSVSVHSGAEESPSLPIRLNRIVSMKFFLGMSWGGTSASGFVRVVSPLRKLSARELSRNVSVVRETVRR